MFEIPRERARDIRALFLRVLDSAAPSYKQGDFFAAEDEKFITREVQRKLHEAKLPNGGSKERKWVERLRKMAMDRDWADAWRAGVMAEKFAAVEGRYYTRKPMSPSKQKDEYEWTIKLIEAAQASREPGSREKVWFGRLKLAGLPEVVSDFNMQCLFLVEKPDGNMDRLIRLVNVRGEATPLIPMDATAFHAPTKFREFCLNKGNFAWQGGEKELQAMHEDVDRAAAWRNVKQITSFGWHALGKRLGADGLLPGIWFFDDCAIAEGKMIVPDKDGIYWHGDRGYIIEENAREGKFLQRRPTKRPDVKISDLLKGGEDAVLQKDLSEPERLREFFVQLCTVMKLNLGKEKDYEGFMVVGSMLSFIAAPEIYLRESEFPGLWVHGQAGGGKSTLCRMLMAMWGLFLNSGLDLISKQVTAIGLANLLEQYSNIPAWADEFRQHAITDDKLTLIRSGYNRTEAAKFNPTGMQREVRTNFLVSGESTTTDAATRGRYPHVQVAASRRQGTPEEQAERMLWCNRNMEKCFLLTRYVLLHRAVFVKAMLEALARWKESPQIQNLNPRLRGVYGASYAAWCALNQMLEAFPGPDVAAFREFMLGHSNDAASDVTSEVNINVFWTDLLTAFKAGQIPLTCFKLKTTLITHPPGAPNQGQWRSHTLYIDPEQTIASMKIYLTKMRATVVLNRNDLRDQLGKNDYWIPGKHQIRFTRASLKAWAIALDRHPEGYQPITDEQATAQTLSGEDERRGPLFEIVQALLQERQPEE